MENENRQPSERPSRQENRPKKKKRSALRVIGGFFRTLFLLIFTMILIGGCAGAMFMGILYKYIETDVMPKVVVNADDYTMNLSSIIYYQDTETEEWVELQTIHGQENRIWVDFDQMPDALWQSVVAIEDERFFQHGGVDWKRTAGAVLHFFSGGDTYGGSTITQQLLKNMTMDNAGTVNRKIREIFRALEFEKNYTKQDILEMYLNTIYLGKSCYGVQTAAQYYFGKDVSELTVAECASLIAITNNPSMYGPMSSVVMTNPETGVKKNARQLNKKRQENILYKMYDPETGLCYLDESEYKAAKAEVLQFTDGSTSAEELVEKANGGIEVDSWFVDQVVFDVSADLAKELNISEAEARIRLNNGGYHIYTTLDPKIQSIAERVYADRSNLDVTSRSGQPLQSGITIIEPGTGCVRAIVGAIGEKSGNLVWSYATGRRQVGSSIKPLTVYSAALDAGAVTPATVFDDYPVRLLNGNPWPKNSPQRYRGMTMLGTGVQHSINTIAIQTLEAVGTANSFAYATEKLHLNLVADDMNLSALGLGGLTYGLNTEEMAAAYACFANHGIYNKPRTYVRVTDSDENVIIENDGDPQEAMKETTAYLMTQMLQTVVQAGTGTSANFGNMSIAGKTGTTSDNYDRYFVGYTPYYVAAVWTGYDKPEKISYSGNPAITMWKKVMAEIHKDLPNASFDKPSTGLETVSVCMDSGLLPTDACRADPRGRITTVTVASGTAPKGSCPLHEMVSYCPEGKCLATPGCPEDVVVQGAFLNYTRTDYGSVYAEDNAYLISAMQKAIEPNEETGFAGGCPVHGMEPVETPPEEDPLNPEDPGFDPFEDPANPGAGHPTTPPAVTPQTPSTPAEPVTPPVVTPGEEDPTGGLGDDNDWWQNLWEKQP